MTRCFLAALALSVSLPFAAHAQAPLPPSFACAKATAPVEKAICDDGMLASLDRLVARGLRFAMDADPAGAEALRADQRRWLATRDAAFQSLANIGPLVRTYEERLRALIRKAGGRGLAGALAAAAPIDPLRESGPQAEENAAFVSFVLTTLYPQPAVPVAPGDADMLTTYERYAGFTYIAPVRDGRLLVAVPEDCGAYQCTTVPFALDRKAGTATRLAVEVPDKNDAPRPDPKAMRVGIVTVANGVVDIFDLARGAGDCGTRWIYRVQGGTLALVKRTVKPNCDGKEWSEKNTTTKVFR
ncbi:MAG TPA: DUF1176 domain-containing protein [Azospirillum sp.]|nr:DUF1176 domain-containing protein [Azospirillum sp.]